MSGVNDERTNKNPWPLTEDVQREIFKQLACDQELFQCLLVSWDWTRHVVPLLYPAVPYANKKFIETMLKCLNGHEKRKLIGTGLSLPAKYVPLFEYSAYVKELDLWLLLSSCKAHVTNNGIYSLSEQEWVRARKIMEVLCRCIIRSSLSLNTLNLYNGNAEYNHLQFPDFSSIPNITTALSTLVNFSYEGLQDNAGALASCADQWNILKFFYLVQDYCRNLQSFSFTFGDTEDLLGQRLSDLFPINSRLRSISLAQVDNVSVSILATLKRSYNSLNSLTIQRSSLDVKLWHGVLPIFPNCRKLCFVECDFIDDEDRQDGLLDRQVSLIDELYVIKHNWFDGYFYEEWQSTHMRSLNWLTQLVGPNLRILVYHEFPNSMVFETIGECCRSLHTLSVCVKADTMHAFLEMLEGLNTLSVLSVKLELVNDDVFSFDGNGEFQDLFWTYFAEAIPETVQQLCITKYEITPDELTQFCLNCGRRAFSRINLDTIKDFKRLHLIVLIHYVQEGLFCEVGFNTEEIEGCDSFLEELSALCKVVEIECPYDIPL